MAKLNGLQSIGSIVNYKGVECVVVDASIDPYSRNNAYTYELTQVAKSVGYGGVYENHLTVSVLKTPLKKHLTKLNSIDNKIKRLEAKLQKEMNKIEKSNGWDNAFYDDYEHEHAYAMDGISFNMGLDALNDERYDLLQEMANTAKTVKEVA
ncbi:hypothetical protein [Priestia megaterium]|uniref:hypothetical protein n=1 Tax=Priestia megaterium TaxID=1404 RepID=UPI002877A8EE|nr:hypothetical protein [Priestia megaterium]